MKGIFMEDKEKEKNKEKEKEKGKEEKEPLSTREKIKLILDIGQLMMENGADSKQIVRDMLRCAAYLGIYWEQIQIHITYFTIMISVDEEEKTITMFRKCYRHGVNMNTILQVSRLSWRALQNNEPYGMLREHLQEIRQNAEKRLYSPAMTFCAIGLASAAFCLLFGGAWYEAIYTFFAAVIGAVVRSFCERNMINGYLGIAASAFASTFTVYFSMYLPGNASPWLPVVACALTLIPGIPLINSVDDFLNNYISSGMTRVTHTILIMFAMTFGIAASVSITQVPSFTQVNILPESLFISQAVAAALAAAGFAVMFNIPRRFIAAACMGAIITVDVRNILMVDFGMGIAFASFLGAATLSVLLFSLAYKFHEPVFVVIIPSVIALLPGVLLYRFLFGIIVISSQTAETFLMTVRDGVTAMLVLLGLAIGAALPEVLGHRYIERSKEKRLRRLLVRKDSAVARYKDAADLDQASNRT